ncbi:MAG TPA: DUF2294 domain-containing protein [Solirubrobacteraceae bacterium]|nr:DUF2294 domain-containing protein [Solirubrobacteraceae bacterium]
MLARLSDEMVRAQKEYFGKGPTQAKSYMLDDMLFIVMRGGMTVAEKTMLEFKREDEVREFRQIFENEMAGRLTGMVEDVTGRKVLTYQSMVMFDPDVVVEAFVFDETLKTEGRAATAEGQLEDDDTGAATDDAPLEDPESPGQ